MFLFLHENSCFGFSYNFNICCSCFLELCCPPVDEVTNWPDKLTCDQSSPPLNCRPVHPSVLVLNIHLSINHIIIHQRTFLLHRPTSSRSADWLLKSRWVKCCSFTYWTQQVSRVPQKSNRDTTGPLEWVRSF